MEHLHGIYREIQEFELQHCESVCQNNGRIMEKSTINGSFYDDLTEDDPIYNESKYGQMKEIKEKDEAEKCSSCESVGYSNQAYDRNLNFKGPEIILPQPLDIGWPTSGFQQLLPQHKILLPMITKSQIEGYFLYRMAEDHDATNDVKAMYKGSKMFAANRILACSIHYTEQMIYI
ncbi:hypothetical protein KUTeg_021315 [Tegillarca granosa]|uniref:Uncharacterized protein n=1 Tax=Tegillarca granosa TaxID=220873 RepID=A0ABQ9EAE5_TEGGR|nr:hypothetical protein KUTeg_021315 [Tegillarca granosa]